MSAQADASADASSAKDNEPDNSHAADADVQAVLTRSARGASILISLQVGSRALTFLVNNGVIRFVQPELLGISAKFELLNISILTFCRESIRIALGRQGQPSPAPGDTAAQKAQRYEPARRAQSAVNLSYVAIALSPVFALLFSWFLFWFQPDSIASATPFYRESLAIYVLATVLELVAEPGFSIAAQQNLYGLRATAETSAAVARAVISGGLAVASTRGGLGLGALPFAAGQLSFAVMINLVYYRGVLPRARAGGYAARLKQVPFPTAEYAAGYVRRSSMQLAMNLYSQSGLKFLLTQGDGYVMTCLTSVSTLGVYSLATNYGALLARMVFQPIEESSRGVFAGLLSKHTNKYVPQRPEDTDDKAGSHPAGDHASSPDPNLISARNYLVTILRLYSLLSLGLVSLLPAFAPLLLSIVAGSQWASTQAPQVLGVYAYYLPLLAFNGILEAFVAATASPAQIQTQNQVMVAFTIAFLGAAYLVLSVGDAGPIGMVAANAVNMAMRIVWSFTYVSRWFAERRCALPLAEFIPRASVIATGLAVSSFLQQIKARHTAHSAGPLDLASAAQMIGLAGAYGLLLLAVERKFLLDCYRLLRPKKAAIKQAHEKSS